MANILYRFYSATGQLLYVGITMNPPARFQAHRKSKDWWSEVAGISIEHYDSRQDLENAERRAIQVEHPRHNVVHAKPAPRPPITEPDEPPTTAIDDDLAALFAPPPLPQLFSGGSSYRETRYRFLTEEQYLRRVTEEREKQSARQTCTLCDKDGYRGLVVCDHVDRTGRWARAQRAVKAND